MRFDVPVIGLNTVKTLIRSRAAGIAIEAGKTLFIDREASVALADKKGNVPVVSGSKLDIALDEYSSILAYINSDPYAATQGDLSKLATRAKRILIEIAKDRGLRHEWDAKEKMLTIDARSIDLS